MDGGQSGSQDSRKTMDLRGETHISYIREPKVRLLSTLQTYFQPLECVGGPYERPTNPKNWRPNPCFGLQKPHFHPYCTCLKKPRNSISAHLQT